MRKLVALLLFSALAFGLPGAALAHGGVVVYNENVGPYGIAVLQVSTGESRNQFFTVYLTEPDNGPEILGAKVTMTSSAPGQSTSSIVLPEEPKLPGYYETTVPYSSSGPWNIDLHIEGPLGAVDTTYPVTIPDSASPLSFSVWALALLPIIAAAGVLLFFWVRSGREPFTEDGVMEEA